MELVKYVRLDETKIFTIFSVGFFKGELVGEGKDWTSYFYVGDSVYIFISQSFILCYYVVPYR